MGLRPNRFSLGLLSCLLVLVAGGLLLLFYLGSDRVDSRARGPEAAKARPAAPPAAKSTKNDFTRESRRLKESWDRQSKEALQDYLVKGYQNPQINVESILTRHQLLEWLFPGLFSELKREELAYTVETLRLFNEALDRHNTQFKLEFKDTDTQKKISLAEESLKHRFTVYQNRWADTLKNLEAKKASLLEPACGSANEYRFFVSYGIARFFDYKGFDIAEKCIANSRAMFPGIDFEVGNVMKIAEKDKAFDYLIVQDLFEHLSLKGMEKALEEVCRVTKKGLVIVFFNMAQRPDHRIKRVRKYHWNLLSETLITNFLLKRSRDVRVVNVQKYLKEEFGFSNYYNPKAYTFVVNF